MNVFRKTRLMRILALLITTLLFMGCGNSSQDDFVLNNAGNATGSVDFNFVRVQSAFTVPTNTISLQFEFFDGTNQSGNVTLETTQAFAAAITINGVPLSTLSYRVTARDANGLPLQVSTDSLVFNLGSATADSATATTTVVTLNSLTVTPNGNSLAIAETATYSATGLFSNGESLVVPDVTWSTDIPGRATIDPSTGVLTAISPGAVVVTATKGAVSNTALVTITGGQGQAFDLFVSNNGGANNGDLDFFSSVLGLVQTFDSGGNQGVTFDNLGTAYHGTDDDNLRILGRLSNRTGSFDPSLDRVHGITIGTMRGSDIAQDFGLMILADSDPGAVVVTGQNLGGGSNLANRPTPAPAWDVAYDNTNDRLFVALTNGDIGVKDNFIEPNINTWFVLQDNTPINFDRTILSVGSSNSHGIAYDPATDHLVVSDVGNPADNTDGKIFVIPNASTADRAVLPSITIAGPNSQLGNPVDIDLRNGDLYVAEKANNHILLFAGILSSAGGDVSPSVSVAEDSPESLASFPQTVLSPDSSDLDQGQAIEQIVVSSNPGAGQATTGSIFKVPATMNSNTTVSITDNLNLEGVHADGQGDLQFCYEVVSNARNGVAIFSRVANNTFRDTREFLPSFDYVVLNDDTTVVTKGLDVSDDRGVMFLADNGGSNIIVVGKQATLDNILFQTPTAAAPWDMDYDPGNDRLYVAFTNGTIGVYDNYLDGANPATATPNRTITPTGSVNLHGIVHDAANDILLVSDVGNPASNSDGQLFVVANASTANGTVNPTVTIGGAATNLGNPTDVAYNGTNLWVTEKANNLLLRFDSIRNSVSGNVEPAATLGLTSPEALTLVQGTP